MLAAALANAALCIGRSPMERFAFLHKGGNSRQLHVKDWT